MTRRYVLNKLASMGIANGDLVISAISFKVDTFRYDAINYHISGYIYINTGSTCIYDPTHNSWCKRYKNDTKKITK